MATLSRLDVTLPATHTAAQADLLLALLARHVPHGWQERSLPTGEFTCTVYCTVADSAAAVGAVVRILLPQAATTLVREEETDWVEAWKEYFTPVEAGRFLVLAPWMAEERAACELNGRLPIIIEPRTAFGTGHHPTTALCLEAIDTLFEAGLIRPGMRFLDLGTGSGILGLACARLGLTGEGLDIDMQAVDNALENRTGNHIAPDCFELRQGGLEAAAGPYDLVLANILAEPLRQMAPGLAALAAADGNPSLLVLSGLLAIQAEAVQAAYLAEGRAAPRRITQGEWAALVFPA